jgi:2-amino-4-hydroxy-6-hydroxymethyldihydropteridine diphosphokinase
MNDLRPMAFLEPSRPASMPRFDQTTATSVPVLLGLGANEGDPLAQLRQATRELSRFMQIDAVSSVYRTEPIGGIEQPDFLNIVAAGRFDGSATEFHARLMAIEERLGRRPTVRNGPRVIDIDLLTFGELTLNSSRLTIPHPRLHQRAFVLVPLGEIAPDWRHPHLGQSAAELLSRIQPSGGVARVGTLEMPR